MERRTQSPYKILIGFGWYNYLGFTIVGHICLRAWIVESESVPDAFVWAIIEGLVYGRQLVLVGG